MSDLLYELHTKWNTGKEGLTPVYHELLKDRRLDVRKVLEVGIGTVECMSTTSSGTPIMSGRRYVPGCSLFMWEEYFPNADIYALDIEPKVLINQGRIRSWQCDQSDEASLQRVLPHLGTYFDLIVDDGSHIPAHQVLTARVLARLLSSRGIYVIEDIDLPRKDQVFGGINYKFETRELWTPDGSKQFNQMLIIKAENQ